MMMPRATTDSYPYRVDGGAKAYALLKIFFMVVFLTQICCPKLYYQEV